MYVEFNQDLKKAVIKACYSQAKLNDFMILCELHKLGEITQTSFEKRVKDLGVVI